MKYIANFDIPENYREKRSINLAAVNVMSYIIDVLNEIEPLEVISPSRTLLKKGFLPSKKIRLTNGVIIRLPYTFGVSSKFGRILSILLIQIWLLWFLLFKCKKSETIVVYHSISLIPIIKFMQKIKHFNLILEIREIYSDVNLKFNKKKELDYFNVANKYIFATQLLNKEINKDSKPYVIAPGVYRDETIPQIEKWNDGKIHLVYAGNFRKAKGGAEISVRIAEFLSSDYVIHLLGSGDEASMNEIYKLIDEQNRSNGAKVIYEGEKRGDEFTYFLQKCDIGLSTQNPNGVFNASSFPSKILTYLANGLEVISADIPAVVYSPIGNYINYYHSYDPESIANAIKSITSTHIPKFILRDLDIKLRTDIKILFQ